MTPVYLISTAPSSGDSQPPHPLQGLLLHYYSCITLSPQPPASLYDPSTPTPHWVPSIPALSNTHGSLLPTEGECHQGQDPWLAKAMAWSEAPSKSTWGKWGMEGESRESHDGGNAAKNKDGSLFWGDGLLVLRKHFYKCICPEEGCAHYVWRSWTWAVRLTEFCLQCQCRWQEFCLPFSCTLFCAVCFQNELSLKWMTSVRMSLYWHSEIKKSPLVTVFGRKREGKLLLGSETPTHAETVSRKQSIVSFILTTDFSTLSF